MKHLYYNRGFNFIHSFLTSFLPFHAKCLVFPTLFSNFFVHRPHSNLRSSEVCCISLLGKNRTSLSLIQLILHLFCTEVKFCTNIRPTSGAHCQKTKIYFLNIFWTVLDIKKIQTHSKSRGCALLALTVKIIIKKYLKMCTSNKNM